MGSQGLTPLQWEVLGKYAQVCGSLTATTSERVAAVNAVDEVIRTLLEDSIPISRSTLVPFEARHLDAVRCVRCDSCFVFEGALPEECSRCSAANAWVAFSIEIIKK
jgi:hypothetical protein